MKSNCFILIFLTFIILVFFITNDVVDGDGEQEKKKKKKKKQAQGPETQTIYKSADPALQAFLTNANISHIETVEETLFVRISGTKYTVSVSPMNYFRAYMMCRMKGGYSIDSGRKIKEAGTLFSRINWPVSVRIWSTGNCLSLDGRYRWFNTGEDIKDPIWGPGEPALKKECCLDLEKVGESFVMKTVDCTKLNLAVCEIPENHKHGHAGNDARKKKHTVRMHSLFS